MFHLHLSLLFCFPFFNLSPGAIRDIIVHRHSWFIWCLETLVRRRSRRGRRPFHGNLAEQKKKQRRRFRSSSPQRMPSGNLPQDIVHFILKILRTHSSQDGRPCYQRHTYLGGDTCTLAKFALVSHSAYTLANPILWEQIILEDGAPIVSLLQVILRGSRWSNTSHSLA